MAAGEKVYNGAHGDGFQGFDRRATMPSCNACNVEFADEAAQRAHYRSEWHRHNLKRKVAGVPGVSEALFNSRLAALEAEKQNQEARMIYTCSLCNKSYATEKAHSQHLQSKLHLSRASGTADSAALVRPAPVRGPGRPGEEKQTGKTEAMETDDDDDEWEEVEADDIQSFTDEDLSPEWNPAQCFFCDSLPDGTVEGCVEHMHKDHGFFIPDAEYLKDARGMLSYLGLKVTEGYMCLYCDDRGKRYQSLEAVRKHMIAKSHCKLHYGDGAEDELEDFYDFSESYKEQGRELMAVDQGDEAPVALVSGGYELVIRSSDDGTTKTLGSRELHRYYRQKHRPVDALQNRASVNAVVAKYRSMGLATRDPHAFVHAKETKKLPSVRLENMRTKLGLKNNVLRNLPKNCTH